jgi:urease accessory protein
LYRRWRGIVGGIRDLINTVLADEPGSGWQARLDLGFAPGLNKTLLAKRSHVGPLTVQRPFYPEGKPCHVYILHPPGGIVGGDKLHININADTGSHALLTTPAAGKFYRTAGAQAKQTVAITIADDAIVEWLPQETIIYDGANLKSSVQVQLSDSARFIGWEILCLGRPASLEGFADGIAELNWQILSGQRPLFLERLRLDARAFAARWGMQSLPVCGTLFATPASTASLDAVRGLIGETPHRGVTRIDNMLVCRALDNRSDQLREFFEQVWAIVRPDTLNCIAVPPRIWAT